MFNLTTPSDAIELTGTDLVQVSGGVWGNGWGLGGNGFGWGGGDGLGWGGGGCGCLPPPPPCCNSWGWGGWPSWGGGFGGPGGLGGFGGLTNTILINVNSFNRRRRF